MRSFLLFIVGLVVIIGLAAGTWFGFYVITPVSGNGETLVEIPRGAGTRTIKKLLAGQEIIRDDIRFLILARMMSEGKRLRAGEFKVPLGLTPLEVIRFLASAKPVSYRITIPEGWTMEQVAAIFGRDNWVEPEEFLRLCRDRDFIVGFGLSVDSLEGYLFPDTYTLVRGEVDEKSLITGMVNRFFAVWNSLEKPAELNYSRHQLLTLASIVEKETGMPSERPLIAAVFFNRLNKGMRLQSDPTTIYGLNNFDGDLTRADLEKATPYNTYTVKGLPPGPICNPGRAALGSVLRPADMPYYYFVSKNDGSHFFSTTLAEHNRAVSQFQKLRRTNNEKQE